MNRISKVTIESNLYRLNRYLNILAQSSELSAARMQVLNIIKEKNPITLRQLCDIQQVKMPTMSKLVDELQEDALVFRAQSKDDARQKWIVPTQKGLQLLSEVTDNRRQFWRQKLSCFDEGEQKQLSAALEKLNQELSKEIAEK